MGRYKVYIIRTIIPFESCRVARCHIKQSWHGFFSELRHKYWSQIQVHILEK